MTLTAAEIRVGVSADTSRLASGLRQGDSQLHAAGTKSAGVFKQAFALGIGTIGAQLATSVISRGIGFVTDGISKLRDEGRLVAQTNAVLRSSNAGVASSMDGVTVKAKTLAAALRDPVKGLKTLDKAGVDFNASQEKQIKALVKVGDKAKAQAIIRQQVATAAKSTAVLPITAANIDTLAESIKNLTGIQDEEVRGGANLLLTFTNIKNAAGAGNDIFNQAVTSATDLSVALGQDMKSSAIQLGKALNDPIRGVTALRRVGVSFTKDQEKQIKDLVTHNHLLDAQKLILRELNKEFGGSAKAFGESDAGSAAKLSNAIEDSQKAIAKGLLPGVSAFQKTLTKTLTDPATIKALTEFGRTLGDTLGAIPWGSIASGLSMIASSLKIAVGALNTLPGPLKSGALALLIGSHLPIVGGPIKGAVGGLLGLPGALIGNLLGRRRGGALGAVAGAVGEAGATPVHVVNFPPGFGGAGDLLGAAAGGGASGGPIARLMSRIPILGGLMSGGGVLATILPFVPAIAAASVAAALISGPLKDTWDRVTKQGQDVQSQATRFGQTATLAQLQASRAGVQGQLDSLDPLTKALDLGGARSSIEAVLRTLDADIKRRITLDAQAKANRATTSGRDPIANTLRAFVAEFRHEARASSVAQLHQAQNTVNAVLGHSKGGSFQTLSGLLAGLTKDRAKALKAGDTVAVKGFDKLIAAVQKRDTSVTTARKAELDGIITGVRQFIGRVTGTTFDAGRTGASQRAHAGTDPVPRTITSDGSKTRAEQRHGFSVTTSAVKTTDTRAINRSGFNGVQTRLTGVQGAVRGVEAAVRTSLKVTVTPSPVTITLDGRAIGTSQIKYNAARSSQPTINRNRATPA